MLSRQPLLLSLAAFAALLWFWHFASPKGYSRLLPVYGPQKKPEDRREKPYWSMSSTTGALEGLQTFQKPDGLNKVSAMIFYGRPATVSILDCYLKVSYPFSAGVFANSKQRNLIKNGGMLDEVIWVVRTTNPEDLAWLDVLLDTEPAYKKWNVTFADKDYRGAYDQVENGTMYIKIDDDIVFFEDSVIPTIVHTKWHHPEYFIVSANIMNQPSLSWVHYHMEAVHPYLPELNAVPSHDPNSESDVTEPSWRASELPKWEGPQDFKLPLDWEAPHKGLSQHRWLPLRPSYSKNGSMQSQLTIEDTPIRSTSFDPFSKALFHWTIAAQQHYSFFENLENNELWRYKFHSWNYNYTRMGIQFVAIMGDDINLGKPMKETDDEYYFTQIMPERLKRRKSYCIHYANRRC
jgi:hypothetical protein